MNRKFKSIIHKWKIGKMESHVKKTRWEEDYEMIENEGLFEEYLEMGESFMISLTVTLVFIVRTTRGER